MRSNLYMKVQISCLNNLCLDITINEEKKIFIYVPFLAESLQLEDESLLKSEGNDIELSRGVDRTSI